jgi:hypothetical protein
MASASSIKRKTITETEEVKEMEPTEESKNRAKRSLELMMENKFFIPVDKDGVKAYKVNPEYGEFIEGLDFTKDVEPMLRDEEKEPFGTLSPNSLASIIIPRDYRTFISMNMKGWIEKNGKDPMAMPKEDRDLLFQGMLAHFAGSMQKKIELARQIKEQKQ